MHIPTVCLLGNDLDISQAHLVFRYIFEEENIVADGGSSCYHSDICCSLVSCVTFVSHRQCAVEVLLLHHPSAVIDLAGDPTGALAVDLDGCQERRKQTGVQPLLLVHHPSMSLEIWISWNSCSWIAHTDSAGPPLGKIGMATNFPTKHPSLTQKNI